MNESEFVSKNIEKFSNDLEVKRRMFYYSYALSYIESKCLGINDDYCINYNESLIEHTKTRIKSFESLLKKAYKKNLELNLDVIEENIFDIAGIKIICNYISNIYTLEKYILEQNDIILVKRKDYIANPKPSGYRSLHLIVQVIFQLCGKKHRINIEIQIRTMPMDYWASLEHDLKYKYENNNDEDFNQLLFICSQQCEELDNKMEYLKFKYGKDYNE